MAARYLWASPNSLIGLILLPLTLVTGGACQWVNGVLEIHGGLTTWFLHRVCGLWLPGGATAMTLGHVVLGTDPIGLDQTRGHERVHVRQYERWGPAFLPAYLGASLVLWCRGADGYFANPFEKEARRLERVADFKPKKIHRGDAEGRRED